MSAAAVLDGLDDAAAATALTRCCGASRWVRAMLALRPFRSDAALRSAAQTQWSSMAEADWLEAFGHHPEIGTNIAALRDKFAPTASWSSTEQRAVGAATESTLAALRDGNVAYRERFGFIFIVCATGKSAAQMLALLRARLPNGRTTELVKAAAEQGKITQLRLAKLGAESAC